MAFCGQSLAKVSQSPVILRCVLGAAQAPFTSTHDNLPWDINTQPLGHTNPGPVFYLVVFEASVDSLHWGAKFWAIAAPTGLNRDFETENYSGKMVTGKKPMKPN